MIDLPEHPAPADATPVHLDYGAILKPATGGTHQRINKLGNRFGLNVTLPAMHWEPYGRRWLNKLIQGKTQGARMEWPLMGFDPGEPGAITVNGSDQAGSTLNVEGASPYYAFREGQFFSVVTDGRHHIYSVATETIASSTGTAALPLSIMLRAEHLDGDVCHFIKPMIEGFIDGDEQSWGWSLGNFTAAQFRIDEAA